jgi:hypothetical protein
LDKNHGFININKKVPLNYLLSSNLRFVKQNEEEWGDADILITANPVALENKPSDKISVKIKAPYNQNVAADYELESILDFITDMSLREKITNTKIINQE